MPVPQSSHEQAVHHVEGTSAPLRLIGNRPIGPAKPPDTSAAPAFDKTRTIDGLKYHWFLFIVLGSLLGGGIGALAFTLLPSKYTTYSLVRVSMVSQSLISNKDASHGEFATYLKTQANLVHSEFVLRAAMRDSKIGNTETLKRVDDPIRWMEENILVEVSENSEIMKVSMTGDIPQDLADIINAVLSAYMKEIVLKEQLQKKSELDQLETIQRSMDTMLDNKRMNQAAKNKVADPNSAAAENDTLKIQMGREQFQKMTEELRQTEMAFTVAQGQWKDLEARLAKLDTQEVSPADLEDFLNHDPKYQDLVQRADKKVKYEAYLRRVGTDLNSADYQNAAREAEAAKAAVEEDKRKTKTDLSRQMQRAARMELEKRIEEKYGDVQAWDIRAKRLKNDLANMPKLPPLAVGPNGKTLDEFDTTVSDIIYLEKTIEQILNRINVLRVDVQSLARVQVIQRASVPIKRDMKKQLFGTAFGVLFGFGLIGGCITLYESRVLRLFRSKELTSNPAINLIGVLPQLTGAPTERKDEGGLKNDPFMEAVDKVRILLARNFLGKRAQSILITSAEAGEGKTTLAGHLAVSMTKTDRKTILVDCNLRQPGMHEHLGLNPSPGVCELMASDDDVHTAIQRTGIPNLWFLSAGAWDGQSQQALGHDRFRRILEKLRQEFDFVIVDSHALLPVADSFLIGQHCDAIVVCARRYVSKKQLVEQMYQKVCDLGAAHTGLIFMGESQN
jgi:capsular exopolysaccharide synthesis family protein